jgi:hypothetical protein
VDVFDKVSKEGTSVIALSVHPYAFDLSLCITSLCTCMIVPYLYVVAGDGVTSKMPTRHSVILLNYERVKKIWVLY